MIIKEEKYKHCESCKQITKTINERVYGCDNCKKELRQEAVERNYLEIIVFNKDDAAKANHMQFCSWKCVLSYLPKIECDYFVSLPYIHYDTTEKGLSAKDFLKLLKK